MTSITILIPTNTPLKLNDAFTKQCQNICKSLSKKIKVNVIWVMFPSLPPYEKHDYISINDKVIFSDDFESLNHVFEHIKPDIVFVNGSLDFHNLKTILVSKFKHIPVITFFFRNPYFKEESFFSIFKSRFRGVTAEYNFDNNTPNLKKSFTIIFFFKQFKLLFKTLRNIEFSNLHSFIFILKYMKIVFSKMSPTHKLLSGDINLCNIEKNKNILINSNFQNSSIFVIGDPYFDNHDLSNLKNPIKNSTKIKILFVTTPNHEHNLCSSKDEFNLIIDVINLIMKHDFDVALKIHPSSSRMSEYVDELKGNLLKPVKIFQSEDLVELLKNYDIMLTYGGTSAIHDAIFLGKPIVNLDFDSNLTGQVVHHDDQIIIQCQNITSLIYDIEFAKNKNIDSNDIENFFKKYLGYSKEKPSELATNIIYTFLKKSSNNPN